MYEILIMILLHTPMISFTYDYSLPEVNEVNDQQSKVNHKYIELGKGIKNGQKNAYKLIYGGIPYVRLRLDFSSQLHSKSSVNAKSQRALC